MFNLLWLACILVVVNPKMDALYKLVGVSVYFDLEFEYSNNIPAHRLAISTVSNSDQIKLSTTVFTEKSLLIAMKISGPL